MNTFADKAGTGAERNGPDQGSSTAPDASQRAASLILSAFTVIGTLVSDILLAWFDPRIRYA